MFGSSFCDFQEILVRKLMYKVNKKEFKSHRVNFFTKNLIIAKSPGYDSKKAQKIELKEYQKQ